MKITLLIFVLVGVLSSYAMEQNDWQAQWIGAHPKSEVKVSVEPRAKKISIPKIVIEKAVLLGSAFSYR